MKRAIVIGAGLAGLAAARTLAREGGFEVTVLEQEQRSGGQARTLRLEDFRADIGPHRMNTELPEAQAIFDEMPAEARIETARRSSMFLEGRFYRYPPSLIELGLRMPLRTVGFGLSFLEARLGGGRGVHGRARTGTDNTQALTPKPQALAPAPRPPIPDPRSAAPDCAALLRRYYGERLYEFFFRPYMSKVWKADPTRLDGEIVRLRIESGGASAGGWARLGQWARLARPRSVSRLRYLRGGIEALPAKLAEDAQKAGVRIICGAQVTGMEARGERISAVTFRTAEGAQRIEADIVLSTAPLPDLAQWLAPLGVPSSVTQSAAALEFLRLILVNVIVDKPRAGRNSWIYFPDASLSANRAHEPKNFDPSMAPPERSMLCFEITCHGQSHEWDMTDHELMIETELQLEHAGILPIGATSGGFIHRVEHAYPLYALGFRAHLDSVLDGLSRFENLITFGRQGLFNHNNMDHSIVMGLRAARAAQSDSPSHAMRAFDEEFKKFRIVD
ncbi:MAG: FAD-dependent oxidoreductase [Candidatus Sumerlaeota bacterium]|nr:FAD-dependent oxidoreductase [Candidatus Sumerlaeota bacterium]